jgi:hypothetical protein
MKYNKWTLGLAAVGVVSLASVAQAEEKMTAPESALTSTSISGYTGEMTALQSALSSTTISGYIDTSAHWNLGTGNSVVGPAAFQGPGKSDGFNLNVVQLTISKPLDEAEWASGYRADLWFGPDANSLATQSIFASGERASQGDFAIRQAYLALRTPVGNGIDWKFGVFDTIIGYESLEAGNNPNYTRSYGHLVEPTTHTGALATYRINDVVSVSAGIANTFGPAINERAHGPNASGAGEPAAAESYKTYMGSIALTAPDSWGWAAGSALYGGVINGFNSATPDTQTSWYVGGTLATPVAGLKFGAAFDYVDFHNFPSSSDSVWVAGVYASYQATEKLSAHLRGEYLNGELPGDDIGLYELTATLQYDLWKNVISRVEFRWDHACFPNGGRPFGGRTGSGSGPWNEEENGNYEGDFKEVSSYPYYEDVPGFKDYHRDSFGILDLLGVDYSYNPNNGTYSITQPGDHGKRNAFLIALNLIYKF